MQTNTPLKWMSLSYTLIFSIINENELLEHWTQLNSTGIGHLKTKKKKSRHIKIFKNAFQLSDMPSY